MWSPIQRKSNVQRRSNVGGGLPPMAASGPTIFLVELSTYPFQRSRRLLVPLLQRVTLEKPQSNQRALAPPLGTSPRLGVPERRLESVGRRHGPSLAQDGYPGVLPGYPRIQDCVGPAWFYGAPKIKIKSRSRSRASLRIVGASGQ